MWILCKSRQAEHDSLSPSSVDNLWTVLYSRAVPFVAIPGAAKVEVLYTWMGSKNMALVMHAGQPAEVPTPWTAAEVASIAEAVWTATTNGATGFIGEQTHDITELSVRVTDLSTSSGPQFTTVHPAVNGAAAGSSAPPADAVVVSLLTSLRSRSGRGRIYVPGFPAGSLDAHGAISAPLAAYMESAVAALDAALTASTAHARLAVASRRLGTYHNITGQHVHPLVRTQRRRELDH